MGPCTVQQVILKSWMNKTKTGQLTDHWVLTVQRKNWDPLVLGPALAMDRIPGPVCFSWKFSSANLGRKIW